jgi:hypothetical protein
MARRAIENSFARDNHNLERELVGMGMFTVKDYLRLVDYKEKHIVGNLLERRVLTIPGNIWCDRALQEPMGL